MVANWILRDGVDKGAQAFPPIVSVEHGGVGGRKKTIDEGELRKEGCRINGRDVAPCFGCREAVRETAVVHSTMMGAEVAYHDEVL